MKKRMMTLLLTAVMVSNILTGCGSEKADTVEPTNDKDVVVEENEIKTEASTEESVEETEAIAENEDIVFDENTVSFKTVCDTIFSESKSNGCVDINVGNIIIYNTKVPASEANGVDETTLFDMYVIDSPLSVENLNQGYVAEINEESYDTKDISYDKATFRDRNDGKVIKSVDGTERYQITLSEADYETVKVFQSPWFVEDPAEILERGYSTNVDDGETLNLRFIDTDANDIADMAAFAYEEDDVMYAVAYINNNPSVVTFGTNDYWLFETTVSEDDGDYVYYTAIEIPASLAGKNIALDTKEMLDDTSISHEARFKTSWGEKLQYN